MAHGSWHRWCDKVMREELRQIRPEASSYIPQVLSGTGSSHSLSSCQAAPQPPLCLSQMLALWKAWPITVAGTRCTGQAIQHPPSPATQWTRLAQGPSRGRLSSPCRETTIPGHLCWTSARSELLGLRGGERWQGTCVGAGAGKARSTVACCVASVRYITSLSFSFLHHNVEQG